MNPTAITLSALAALSSSTAMASAPACLDSDTEVFLRAHGETLGALHAEAGRSADQEIPVSCFSFSPAKIFDPAYPGADDEGYVQLASFRHAWSPASPLFIEAFASGEALADVQLILYQRRGDGSLSKTGSVVFGEASISSLAFLSGVQHITLTWTDVSVTYIAPEEPG